jgi:hypothetical protein
MMFFLRRSLVILFLLALCFQLFAWRGFYSLQPSEREISRADSLTGFDVQKYTVDLQIDDANHYLEGSVTAEVLAEADLNQIQYRLAGGNLAVSKVLVDAQESSFVHTDGIITIPLQVSSGMIFSTQVFYQGNPGNSPAPYNIGLIFTNSSFYTLSNPDAGRYYMPTYDHPWDKALIEWRLTLRADWLAAANGIRQSITDNGDGTHTHHWLCQYPVATYVMGFAAAPYIEFLQQAGDLPIQNFVLPSQLANAQVDFANVPAMIDYFSSIFGAYPFEKYGHMVVNMSTYAAMEHQTMTTFGAQYLDGQQGYESIVAHELAHQWYGNFLTPITMREVWLKESFATYSEALWMHHKEGWQAACDYIRDSIQDYYITWANRNGYHTIFNPEYNLMFAPPTYEKSASVLHMLRLKMGDEAFFPFIRSLLNSYPNSNINTTEFIALAQQHSGMDLQQFFQQWIFSDGIPSVELAVFTDADQQIKIYAKSSSPTATEFDLEIPIRLTTVADSLVALATPQWQASTFPISLQTQISTLSIDPQNWVLLKDRSEVRMQLLSCSAYSAAVKLSWLPLAADIPLLGYHVFRAEGDEYHRLTELPLTELDYIDHSVANGTSYTYYVAAVDEQGFISLASNIMPATPIDFPMDQGFLVVDETKDGTGAAISPSSETVNDFYDNVLQGLDYTKWSFQSQGAPDLQTLSRYSLILWHSDDFSEHLLLDTQDLIISYVLSGGKILISGWKYPSVFSDSFYNQFLSDISPLYHSSPALISLYSAQYPALYPDPAKLAPVWNNMLPMSYTFLAAEQVFYRANMTADSAADDQPAGIRIDDNGSLMLLGFPLFFMQEDGVRGFLQAILPELEPGLNPIDPATLPVSLDCLPNPFAASDGLSLKLNNAAADKIKIYNLKGQLVLSETLAGDSDIWISASRLQHLALGCYLVQVHSDRGKVQRKVILLK